MRLGLFGLDFKSGNMGCQALAYAFYLNLPKMYSGNIECDIFIEGLPEEIDIPNCDNVDSKVYFYEVKKLEKMTFIKKKIMECDFIVDFTNGDSFSDIYGIKRMIRVSSTKLLTINNNKPLILGPQTFGPYNKLFSKIVAKKIFRGAKAIIARDELSAKQVESLSGRKIEYFTDVAFMLPYEKTEVGNQKIAGINVSGLLWSGGYKGGNQFGLKMDYKEYTKEIIRYLDNKGYKIHLISHVTTKDPNNIENDMTAIKEVHKIFPQTIVAPVFDNPLDAKTYISKMTIFIGARMHATIAGVSTKVPTIPFSYSRKFEGLFGSINYPYVIEATKYFTEEGIEKSKQYIDDIDMMKNDLEKSQTIIKSKVNAMIDWFATQFKED